MISKSAKILSYKDKKPIISNNAFIFDNVVIIGDVIIKDNVNIWPNTTIRADINKILISENTNIQDNCTIHVDFNIPCVIGKNCTIGHNVILHSTNIDDNCLVGMGSILMNNSKMEKNSMIGAGSILTSNMIIKEKQLWLGSPAKYFRDLRDEEIEYNSKSWKEYIELANNLYKSNK